MKKLITFCIIMLFTANAYASIMINFDDVPESLQDITNWYEDLGVTLNAIENPYLISVSPMVPLLGPYPAPDTLPAILGGVTTGGLGFLPAPSPPQVAVSAGTNTLNAGNRGILISFAFDVTSVSLVGNDAGLGYNGRDDECVTLTAYNALGNKIGQVYSTVNLYSDEEYDLTPATISLPEIRYVAFNYTGTYYGFYAIDNLEFDTALTPVVEVEIDIKPGSYPSSINLRKKGVTPVAIHTTDDFDATTVDPLSIRLNDCGLPVNWEAYDCDEFPNPLYGDPLFPDEPEMIGDGDIDLVLYFDTQALAEDGCLMVGDTEATLTGETFDGVPIEGTGDVRIVVTAKGKK